MENYFPEQQLNSILETKQKRECGNEKMYSHFVEIFIVYKTCAVKSGNILSQIEKLSS